MIVRKVRGHDATWPVLVEKPGEVGDERVEVIRAFAAHTLHSHSMCIAIDHCVSARGRRAYARGVDPLHGGERNVSESIECAVRIAQKMHALMLNTRHRKGMKRLTLAHKAACSAAPIAVREDRHHHRLASSSRLRDESPGHDDLVVRVRRDHEKINAIKSRRMRVARADTRGGHESAEGND